MREVHVGKPEVSARGSWYVRRLGFALVLILGILLVYPETGQSAPRCLPPLESKSPGSIDAGRYCDPEPPLPRPAPPTPSSFDVPASDSDGAYTVSWSYSSGASRYQLLESPNNSTWTTIHNSSARNRVISGKSNGRWYYKVRACDSSNRCSGYTATKSVLVSIAAPPPTPSAITGPGTDDDGSFTLSWGSVSGATSYSLERQDGSTGWSVVQNTNSFAYDELGLAEGTYQYRVRACVVGACSNYTPEKTVVVEFVATPTPPTTPPSPAPMVDPGRSLTSDRIGSTEGQFKVDQRGAATYSIPINVAAGTAGLAPSVALSYASNPRNGVAGIGWEISGLSAISRCRQTMDQDRQAKAITWTNNDRFCLDGQRLLMVSGSAYGAPGSSYRPEIDSGVRVTAVGSVNNEPDSFEVRRKDGSVSYYGGTVNSKSSGGNSRTLTWGIREFQDNIGNPIVYEYETGVASLRISKIKYAYGSGSTENASVSFEYQNRDDWVRGFVGGHEFVNDKRLKYIRSHNRANGINHLIREYTLEYGEGQAVSSDKLSRLTSVKECANGACLPKTTFGWRVPASNPYLAYAHSITLAESSDLREFALADINGDGLMDLVWLEGSAVTNAVLNFALSDGTRLTQTPFANGAMEYTPYGSKEKLTAIDYNLDGRQDIAYWDAGVSRWKIIIAVPQNDGSWRLENAVHATPISDKNATFVDVDTDGAVDAIWATGSVNSQKQLYLSLLRKDSSRLPSSSTYYRFEAPVPVGAPSSRTSGKIRPVAADFDGDGRVGIIMGAQRIICEYEFNPPICFGPKHDYALNINNPASGAPSYSSFASLNNIGPTSSTEHVVTDGLIAADVNADGLSDLLYPVFADPDNDVNQFHLAINKGDGTFSVQEFYESTMKYKDVRRPQFVDWNDDGFPDLLWKSTAGTGTVYVRYWDPLTNRLGARQTAANASNALSESILFPDMNGDGVADFMKIDGSTGRGIVTTYTRKAGYTVANQGVNRIETITNGFGAVTHIDYEPLSTSANYERLELGSTTGTATFCESEPGFEFCYDLPVQVPDTESFYSAINSDVWDLPEGTQSLGRSSPVLEFSGPYYAVVKVSGSSPSANYFLPDSVNSFAMSSVSYRYHEAKVQAAGRGFLGFERLTKTDDQTGVMTTTRYRQDWPFVGSAFGMVVRTGDGAVLSTSAAELELVEWGSGYKAAFAAGGSVLAGPAQIVQVGGEEVTYALQEASGGGYEQGAIVRTVSTTTTYDGEANVELMQVTTKDGLGAALKTVSTDNQYDTANFELWDGRTSSTTVTTDRLGQPPALPRVNSFTYYLPSDPGNFTGMLKTETVEPNTSLQKTTTYSYDTWGNRVKAAVSDGNQTRCNVVTTIYDSTGRYVAAEKDCFGRNTFGVIARSEFGQPKQANTYIDTGVTVSTFASFGALGRQYYSYDDTGASSTTYFSSDTTNCPSSATTVSTTTHAGGSESASCFDKLGRSVRSITIAFDGTLNAQDTEYDENGRIRRKSEPFNLTYDGPIASYWTTFDYDILGRITLADVAGSAPVSTVYSGLETEATVNVTPPQTKREIRNALGEVTDTYDAMGGHTQYDYDRNGNLIYVKDHGNNVTTSKFDKLGRKEWTDDLNKGKWEYKYNNFGELIEQKDAKGQITKMTYDGLGRMDSRTDKASLSDPGTLTTWHYDTAANGLGQLSYVHDHETGYHKAVVYDSLGRSDLVTTSFSGSTFSELTTYDQYGRVLQYFDAAGDGSFTDHGIVNLYNSFGYLNIVADAVVVNGASREVYKQIESINARGQVTVEKRGIRPGVAGASVTVTYEYWPSTGRIKDINARNRFGDDVQDLYYQWDANGNLTERHENSGVKNLVETFTYDRLNRLLTFGVGADAVSVTYTPDISGNIDYYTKNGVTYDYEYGEANAGPHAVTKFNGKTLEYDANGNSYETGSGGRTITYTTFDMAKSITANGNHVEFDYAPDRARYRRISTGVSGGQTTTMYVGPVEIIAKADGTQQRKRYIAESAIETSTYNSAGIETGRTTNFLFHDHLGSVDVITGSDGTIVKEMSFDAWGQRRNATDWSSLTASQQIAFDTSLTTQGFTGHEEVDEVGIIHMNGRIYDPTMGRFLQADTFVQDPTDSQSLNRYSYTSNNPLNAIDPSGYFSLKKLLKIVIAVVAAIYTFGAVMSWATQVGGWATSTATIAGSSMSYMTTGGMIAAGAVAGASAGFVSGLVLTGTFKGAAQGAFSGAVFGGLGGAFGNAWSLRRVSAYSVAGGVTSKVNGGSFRDGLVFSLATSVLTYANYKMHQAMVKQSRLNPANADGDSAGAFGSRFKLGGARRTYVRIKNKIRSLACRSFLGGCQGQPSKNTPWSKPDQPGSVFGMKYSPGSVNDYIVEYHAGPHDWFRNATGSYTAIGNAKNLVGLAGFWDAIKNAVLVLPAMPFGIAGLTSHAGVYDPLRAETM